MSPTELYTWVECQRWTTRLMRRRCIALLNKSVAPWRTPYAFSFAVGLILCEIKRRFAKTMKGRFNKTHPSEDVDQVEAMLRRFTMKLALPHLPAAGRCDAFNKNSNRSCEGCTDSSGAARAKMNG